MSAGSPKVCQTMTGLSLNSLHHQPILAGCHLAGVEKCSLTAGTSI